jgi:hypothetical protein
MDKRIELTILEFESSPDFLFTCYFTDPANDVERMLDAALVVVGQVKDEQIMEIKVFVHAKPL